MNRLYDIIDKLVDMLSVIETGNFSGDSIPAGGYKDYTVTFTKNFSQAPVVMAVMYSTSASGTVGRVNVSAHEITATGCKIRIFNGDASARAPGASWIAIGELGGGS